ncbi:MAG: hypothetical protein Q4G36_07435 [Paracoccus sp. (in: a-proteobacteria)]|nr:hypothetical protein [Paracoccus sp. (in: a-proteobacteria)]
MRCPNGWAPRRHSARGEGLALVYFLASICILIGGIIVAHKTNPLRHLRPVWVWAVLVALTLSPLWSMRTELGFLPLILAYGSVPALFLMFAARGAAAPWPVVIWVGLLIFAGLGFLLLDYAPSRQIMGDAGYMIGLWLHAVPMLVGVTVGMAMRIIAKPESAPRD